MQFWVNTFFSSLSSYVLIKRKKSWKGWERFSTVVCSGRWKADAQLRVVHTVSEDDGEHTVMITDDGFHLLSTRNHTECIFPDGTMSSQLKMTFFWKTQTKGNIRRKLHCMVFLLIWSFTVKHCFSIFFRFYCISKTRCNVKYKR